MSESQYVEARRAAQSIRSKHEYAKASDIGDIPAVVNRKRRLACKHDLHLFEQAYFPHSAGLSPFGSPQTRVLERMEGAILKRSGRVLNCEPRGYAKSTKSELAIIWAILYGHRRYGVFFAATGDEADEAIESIKTELQENERLYEDFPEVCHAIRALEGRAQRCATQTHNGNLTHIEWTADTLVLPYIKGSAASGAIIRAKGYMSASRGMRYKRADGTQARPDLVVIDDPQTDESAVMPAQVAKRKKILGKCILRLGGHGKAVSAVMNATVIADGDMIDQLADHKQHPEWQAVRVPMLYSMPEKLDELWLNQYKRIRDDYDEEVVGSRNQAIDRATEFYVANREAMDKGAEPSWHSIPLEPGEVSAIQHAMNILCDDGEDVFFSECQNEPKRVIPAGIATMEPADVKHRHNGFDFRVVPPTSAELVAHCDVHDAILYYMVMAVGSDFTGHVVDYGTFPEQPTPFFSMYNIRWRLQDELGTESVEEAISLGVAEVVNRICGRVWAMPDGTTNEVKAVLVDVGYKPDEVASGARLSDFAEKVIGSRGVGIGPTEKPMTEYDVSPKRVRRAGPDRRQPRWYIPRETVSGLPIVRFDANFMKSLVAARWMQPIGSPGSFSIYGNHRVDHSHLVDHLTAEEPVPVTARGRTVVTWKLKPNRENHWFDNNVGCAVGASLLGLQFPGRDTRAKTPPPPRQQTPRPKAPDRGGGFIQRHDGRPFFITAR